LPAGPAIEIRAPAPPLHPAHLAGPLVTSQRPRPLRGAGRLCEDASRAAARLSANAAGERRTDASGNAVERRQLGPDPAHDLPAVGAQGILAHLLGEGDVAWIL